MTSASVAPWIALDHLQHSVRTLLTIIVGLAICQPIFLSMITISNLHKLFLKTSVVSIDSRDCPEGCIFIALRGDTFDGNKFAAKALENGAAYAVVDNKDYCLTDNYILVENTLETLQNLAAFHRDQFNIPVIAITGTNGKTTTKELIAAILQTTYNTHYTKGNFNNHIGVPLTLLQLNTAHEIAIIEMGANHVGEIKALCNIAHPTHGIITNVGKAHLEGFGSFEGVIETKTELYKYLSKNKGTTFVNSDNPYLWPLANSNTKVVYSLNGFENLRTNIKSDLPFLKIELSEQSKLISSQLTGSYNYENIIAALTIGKYFKISLHDLTIGIENYTPTNNRSQIKQTQKNTLLLDAYNANPSSMEVAINNFTNQKATNKHLILGDMKELGRFAKEEHIKIAKLALNGDFKSIWFIGDDFIKTQESIKPNNKTEFFKTTAEACTFAQNNPKEGYFILIKGSRSMKLEQLETYF